MSGTGSKVTIKLDQEEEKQEEDQEQEEEEEEIEKGCTIRFSIRCIEHHQDSVLFHAGVLSWSM